MRDRHGPDTEIFFVTGADAVWEIITWKDANEFEGLCTFIAATRPGYDLEAASIEHDQELAALSIEFIEVPALAISSTDIRSRAEEGRPISYLVPEPVARYIEKYSLYTGEF
jgi:nicotinate-nucleotide adenylyltransferase